MLRKGIFSTVDEYIALHPAPIRRGLNMLRKTIKQAAPGAEETISYNMPAYKSNGILVYFSAAKNHFGFYPTASPMKNFQEKLKDYETSKGAIRFPINRPVPVKLVSEMVKWKLKENLLKVTLKGKIKPAKEK
jgi:uncharacterized protein YdhG (YjbR/CyaY superfamily)